MADRWQGLGGLATETLASLVQSRDLRDAKAEAQRRYDVEQARIVAEDARVAEERLYLQQQRRANQIREDVGVAGTLTDEQAAAMEAARPGSTEAFTSRARTSPTLASVNRPPSQMGDRPFRSVRFGDEAPVPALDDVSGNVRNIERQAPPSTWLGPALVAGTSETPATSGTRMRMTGAQGKALEKDVAREAAIQALVSDGRLEQDQADLLKQNPDLPAQAWATVFPAPRPAATPRALPSTLEARAVQLLAQADAEPDPAKRAALRGLANDALVRDRAQRQSSRATAPAKGEALPSGVQLYIASLASGGTRNGVTYPARTYDEAKAEVLRAWKTLSKDHKGIDLPTVLATLDKLYGVTYDPVTGERVRWSAVGAPEQELGAPGPRPSPSPAGDPLKLF
jgi:hypothetical protein